MSRIGRTPITIPDGVEVTVGESNLVTVKGPKGTLEQAMPLMMEIAMETGVLNVKRPNDEKETRALHGLTRALINNMVKGVTEGFKKNLEINGVGYRAQKQGSQLVMNLGYSHQIIMDSPEGIDIDVPAQNKITISGIDKQKVGQFAAEVRGKRPPEPYKGKGIRYSTETVRRKEGKSGKTS